MKILHTADWQMGKHFHNITGDAGAALRLERFEAVRRIAALARDQNVAAVLVAGDVFDSNQVSDDTLRRTVNAMSGFSGPWVLLAGNHDAARAQSVWTRLPQLDVLTDNILMATEPAPIQLADGRLWVLPAPLQRRSEPSDLTEYFNEVNSPPGAIRIGLAHGSVSNRLPEKAEALNPIAETRAEDARLDYLALGDWHGTLEIAPRTWYAGTPEADRFRENDPGNVLLVDAQSGQPPTVDTIRTGRYAWLKLDIGLDGEGSDQLLRQRLDALEEAPDTLLDLRLTGMADLETSYRLNQVLAAAKGRFRYVKVDETQLASTPSGEDMATMGATGFVAETVKALAEMAQSDDAGQAARATRALQILYFEHREQAQQ